MNFLAHDWLLGDGLPPLAHVGASLPDLWPLLPVRPLPLVVLRELRAREERDAAALAFGIAHHMHADKAFHGHPAFEARMAAAAPRLRGPLGLVRHGGLAAHIAVEMVLDRWLIERQPHLLADYYARFSTGCRRRATELSHAEPDRRAALDGVLDRFAATRFLADYTSWDGLGHRFVRTLARVGIVDGARVALRRLAVELAALHEELGPGSEALLADVRVRSAASLTGAGVFLPAT
jgi:hypothetical protein